MSERILFLTGRLAEPSLQRVLHEMAPPFAYEVREIGLQVAGLMTADMIRRRVSAPVAADRMLVPGRCRGDLDALSAHYGIPVERGPDELKDIPRHFNRPAAAADLSRHDTLIFAEIVDAPQLTVGQIVERAALLKGEGADVIDLGCLPATPFPHLEDAVAALKAAGHAVSVDSQQVDELRRGGRAGADYLLSLTPDTLWLADEVASVPVVVARDPADEPALHAAVDALLAKGRRFYADPILDPLPFGFTASLGRYQRLRARYPQAEQVPMLMGIANLTELVDADTSGISALLLGVCAELRIGAVLTTQVSPHARRAIREADCARRLMFAAREGRTLPRDLGDALLTVHARRPFPDSPAEIAATAAQVRDPNYRIQIAADGVHLYNRAGHHTATDVFELWPRLAAQGLAAEGAHAFYLGVELARAEIAWQLGKRYAQDEPLDWGVAVERAADDRRAHHAPGATLQKPDAEPAPGAPAAVADARAGAAAAADRTRD